MTTVSIQMPDKLVPVFQGEDGGPVRIAEIKLVAVSPDVAE